MNKYKKAFQVLLKIIKAITITFLLLVLFVVLIQKIGNNKYSVFGYRIFMIVSESMTPEYEIGDILVSKQVDSETIEIGDNITYRGAQGDFQNLVITHQVISKWKEDNLYHFQTKGLTNDQADPEIDENQIYGKVVYKTVFLSFLGQLMRNNVAYYVLFVLVGISLSYEIVCHIKELKDEEEEKEKNN